MENYDDETEVRVVKPISRMEKAFFGTLKWLLFSAVVGTILSFTIDDPNRILGQTVSLICIFYVGGSLYKWYRIKATKNLGVGISE